jgi:alanine dehydrogenase
VDQGGCFEGTHPTTHTDPTFPVHGSIFYCVANMPGAVAQTSTYALTNVTLSYALAIADHGLLDAGERDRALRHGLNTYDGKVVHPAVAQALRMQAQSPWD